MRLSVAFSGVCRAAGLVTLLVGLTGSGRAQSPVPAGNFVQVIPHILSGGGCGFGTGAVTKFTIVNTSTASANQITFNNISQTGVLIDSTPNTIPAKGTLRLQTPEAGRNAGGCDVHWAMVGSQQPVNINLFFEIGSSPSAGNVLNTVGFNDVAPQTSFTLPVELQKQTSLTLGVAIANRSASANLVTLQLFDSAGNQAGADAPVNLVAFGQGIASIESLFSSALPAGRFVGKVVISAPAPIAVIGVGDDFGPFFSVPPAAAASGGGGSLSATFTLTTAPSAGSCITSPVSIPGATTAMVAVISPSGDPVANNLDQMTWDAFVDAADQVTVHFCHFSNTSIFPTNPQVFNIRVLSTAAASVVGTFTLASNTAILESRCIARGFTLAGASPATVIQISAVGNATTAGTGWGQVLWNAYSDATNHAVAHFCKIARGTATTSRTQAFNLAVLN